MSSRYRETIIYLELCFWPLYERKSNVLNYFILLPGELRVQGRKNPQNQTTNKGEKNMGGGLLDNVHSLSSVFGLDQLLLEHLAL